MVQPDDGLDATGSGDQARSGGSAWSDDDAGVEYELDDQHPVGAADVAGAASTSSSRPSVGILLAAVTVLGLLGLVLALFGSPGDWAGGTTSAPSTSATVPTATGDVDPGRLAVTDVNGAREFLPSAQAGLSAVSLCSPTSDGAGHLTVGLQVVNAGSATIRLIDVRPRLRAGLVRLTGLRSGGSCGAPGDGDVALDLAPGARVLVTMELEVLDSCPGSVPVGVRVRAEFVNGIRTVSFPLFADLGSVVFDGC